MAGPSHNEYVADSEDEDLLVDPTFDALNTSMAGEPIYLSQWPLILIIFSI